MAIYPIENLPNYELPLAGAFPRRVIHRSPLPRVAAQCRSHPFTPGTIPMYQTNDQGARVPPAPPAPSHIDPTDPNATPPRSRWIFVTPEIATKWLARNTRNRSVHGGQKAVLALDVQRGDWHLTHQGVAFFASDGALADGQHRLLAIVESGTGLWMLATFGLPDDAALGIDQHARRTARDAILVSDPEGRDPHGAMSILRVCYFGPDRARQSASVRAKTFDAHAAAVMLADSFRASRRAGTSSAAVASVYALAIEAGEPVDRVERFARVMEGAMPAPGEEMAHIARGWAINNKPTGSDEVTAFQLRLGRALRIFIAESTRADHRPRLHMCDQPEVMPWPWFDLAHDLASD